MYIYIYLLHIYSAVTGIPFNCTGGEPFPPDEAQGSINYSNDNLSNELRSLKSKFFGLFLDTFLAFFNDNFGYILLAIFLFTTCIFLTMSVNCKYFLRAPMKNSNMLIGSPL